MKQITEAFGKRLEQSGMTRIQWIALYYIGINKDISQRDLSKMMNVKDSSVGRLIDRMERDGLIQRERSKKDRRIVFVKLTNKGKEFRKKYLPIGMVFNDDLKNGITESELIIFQKVLDKMVENVTVKNFNKS